jgi:hypothetical protein
VVGKGKAKRGYYFWFTECLGLCTFLLYTPVLLMETELHDEDKTQKKYMPAFRKIFRGAKTVFIF